MFSVPSPLLNYEARSSSSLPLGAGIIWLIPTDLRLKPSDSDGEMNISFFRARPETSMSTRILAD